MSELFGCKQFFVGVLMSETKKKRMGAWLVAICSFVYFVSYFSRKSFAAAMAGMIEAQVIDKIDGGYIGMGLFICYGAGQLLSGYLGDKIKHLLMAAAAARGTMCDLLHVLKCG